MRNIITLLIFVLLFTACTSEDDKFQEKDVRIIVDTDHVTLKIGETYKLNYEIINNANIDSYISVDVEDRNIATAATDLDIVGIRGVTPGETTLIMSYLNAEKRIKITVSNEYDLEVYYEKFCYGFRVKDTTDLRIVSYSPEKDEDIPYLFGERNGKLWIGKFNKQSKEQITEYITNKPVSFERTIHTGFGEYVNAKINYADIVSFFETSNGWVTELKFYDSYNSATHLCRLLIFNEGNDTKEYFFNDTDNHNDEYLIKWYDDSFLRRIDTNDNKNSNIYTCFRPNGEIILSGKAYLYVGTSKYGGFTFPVSYDKYILFSKDHYGFGRYVLKILLSSFTGSFTSVNEEYSYVENEAFKYTCEELNSNNNIRTFKVNFTYESGKQSSHIYEIDVTNNTIRERI